MDVRRRPGKASQGQRDRIYAPKRVPHGNKGSKTWLKGVVALAAVLLVVLGAMHLASGPKQPGVLRPFKGTQLKQLPQFGGQHAERLLWGTYRPGYYFGLRMRQPQSLLVGLMWTDPQRQDPLGNIRHEAQQGDGLAKYGWLQHDGQGYGLQELWDQQYNITTAWAKHLCPSCGVGGDWGASITFEDRFAAQRADSASRSQQRQQRRLQQAQAGSGDDSYEDDEDEEEGEEPQRQEVVSLFVYVATEDGSRLQLDPSAVAAALQSGRQPVSPCAAVSGSLPPLGSWQLHLRHGSSGSGGSKPAAAAGSTAIVNYLGLATPHMHNLTEAVRQGLIASLQQQHAQGQRQYRLVLPDVVQPDSNVMVLQITALLPLALDLSFVSGLPAAAAAAAAGSSSEQHRQLADRLAAISGPGLQQMLASGAASFEQRFAATFGDLGDKTTSSSSSSNGAEGKLPAGTAAVARAALSNMLGGIGYWYGHSLVRLKEKQKDSQIVERTARLWDTALYSAVPSRSFFPRGFLWDEGFHQLLIRRWDAAISRDILGHWFDLMNAQGWIAREQILGEEARARVPAEFVQQSPDAANPPTFFLLLSDMSHRVAAAAKAREWDEADLADAEFLTAAWPRLRKWYLWFNTTQAGPVPGSYRWRGRDASSVRELNPKTLTSGLDDAPRASYPSDDERHLDLRCWMALATRALATIGSNLGLPHKEVQPLLESADWLENFESLNALHWHEPSGEYRDWGNHTEDVELQRPMATLANGQQVPSGDMQRAITGQPPRPQLVPQFGYISLFPLLMRLIPPNSPVLARQLDLLRDPERLWTGYGLRSLSRSASLYQQRNTEHDPPYWRGAIWINVNYMAVQALKHYGTTPGPYQAQAAVLHEQLRHNLLHNIATQYNRTGYLWEQYDDVTGQGKGSHPFTGWTALLALMAATN